MIEEYRYNCPHCLGETPIQARVTGQMTYLDEVSFYGDNWESTVVEDVNVFGNDATVTFFCADCGAEILTGPYTIATYERMLTLLKGEAYAPLKNAGKNMTDCRRMEE